MKKIANNLPKIAQFGAQSIFMLKKAFITVFRIIWAFLMYKVLPTQKVTKLLKMLALLNCRRNFFQELGPFLTKLSANFLWNLKTLLFLSSSVLKNQCFWRKSKIAQKRAKSYGLNGHEKSAQSFKKAPKRREIAGSCHTLSSIHLKAFEAYISNLPR